MTDLPVEAVEAVARAIHARAVGPRDAHLWDELDEWQKDVWRGNARAALTAAAPHIAAQAVGSDHWAHAAITAQDAALTAQINEAVKWGREKDAELSDLRAGIEALRDEWQKGAHGRFENSRHPGTLGSCADALDALLREGE